MVCNVVLPKLIALLRFQGVFRVSFPMMAGPLIEGFSGVNLDPYK